MDWVRLGDFFARQGWYPGTKGACLAAVGDFEDYYAGMAPPLAPGQRWVGGVVPHAGWVFSGRLAFRVFQVLASQGQDVDRVVLFGGHLGPFSSGWILTEGVWRTPLGELETDAEFSRSLAEQVPISLFEQILPDDYEPDNTIELQLPFIRHFFPS